ncbi:MAG: hypothetical protein JWS10_3316 [Cypionkella sp.]|nr:hypothetical protein [Cypionkella sp.]
MRCFLAPIVLIFWTTAAHAEAQVLGQTAGALMGMSVACGVSPSENWTRSIVSLMKSKSTSDADFQSAMAVFEDYGNRAMLTQSTDPSMTCEQVIAMMRQSEAAF